MKILFIGDLKTTFIKKDFDLLNDTHDITAIEPPKKKKDWLYFANKCKKEVKKTDIIFAWFASWHAAIPLYYSRRYKKKIVVVVGGYDAAYVPEIDYGVFLRGIIEQKMTRYVLKKSNKILVVDPTLKKQIQYILKDVCDNIDYLPTGYEVPLVDFEKKENIILTVSAIQWSNISRKGLDSFVQIAKKFPKYKFIIAGKSKDNSINYLKKIAGKNVEFTEFLPEDELKKLYEKTKIYCQLSKHEGLPNALCEGMSYGCIPVGTYENGIPRAMGNCGYYAEYGDINEIKKAIDDATKAPMQQRVNGRKRISEYFSIKRRKDGLNHILEKIVTKGSEKIEK